MMKKSVLNLKMSTLALALGAALSPAVQAQTAAEELLQLRAATQQLINTLVESGLLTRDKAAAMLKQVAPGAASSAATGAGNAASTAAGAAPEVGADGKRLVRVPYVPESLRQEMREQIKGEVLSQAKAERWGQPDAYPAWMGRLTLDMDVRARAETVKLAADNTAPGLSNTGQSNFLNGDYTRAPDFVPVKLGGLPSNNNSQNDFDRSRIRARFGVGAQVADQVSVGMRLSTGSSTGSPTSTNQTMGQSFNKYALVLDRAFVQLKPSAAWRLTAGRMNNPYYSTDLVYADDLGFEGFAASTLQKWGGGEAFATAGYFPMAENKPGTTNTRSLTGIQLGNAFKLGSQDEFKLGLAFYTYQGLTAARESDQDAFNPAIRDASLLPSNYATRYEYGSILRQRGNTLFRVNALTDNYLTPSVFGLASEFRILNLTSSLSLNHLLGQPVVVTGDYVKNIGFNAKKIAARTGAELPDGKDTGVMLRAAFGPLQVHHKGQWNASLAYRYLGSDAVLDAFTNSDFGLGGTNNKGWILQTNYGLYTNTWLTARWLSANQIDPFAPGKITKFSSDILQLDLNARF